MPVGKETLARIEQLCPSRVKQLYDELAFALSRTDRAGLRQWGRRAAGRLFHLGARRVGGMAQLVSGLSRFGSKEAGEFYRALCEERLGVHIGRRAAAAIDGTLAVGSEGRRLLIGIVRALRRNPREMAPKVLGLSSVSMPVPGGLMAMAVFPISTCCSDRFSSLAADPHDHCRHSGRGSSAGARGSGGGNSWTAPA
jgi:hypothetical protein